MHPLLNPANVLPFYRHYLEDPVRLERFSPSQLRHYQDRALKRTIQYAATVPVYEEKYKQCNVNPKDIRGINDLRQLPFITKDDLRSNYPDRIIPRSYRKSEGYVVCTGGTSGKPVYIYTDFPTMLFSLGPALAQMRYFQLNLRTSRLANIGNFTRYRSDSVLRDKFLPTIRHFYSTNNILNLDVDQSLRDLMGKLDAFQPDVILTYPSIFQHLAYLKKKGYGDHVNPQLLQVAGDILDEYTRHYVEDAFNCRLLNVYQSVEAQTSIAFECYEGGWHIHSDFFLLEAIDQKNDPVSPGERGHLVITRLFGRGTPILRYTGMEDWITLGDGERCNCGLHSPILKKPVEGRMRTNIVLPSGKVFPPGAFCFIEPVLHDLHTFKIQQYQVVQKTTHEIEILLVVDEELRYTGPSLTQIIEGIQRAYMKKTGPDVITTVREVPEIRADPHSGKPAPIVVSKISREEGYKLLDS
jgi:phenylacetate-CoA ligase